MTATPRVGLRSAASVAWCSVLEAYVCWNSAGFRNPLCVQGPVVLLLGCARVPM